MKWGLIACGRIAKKFITSISKVPEAQLKAIASKSNAGPLREQYQTIDIHDNYEAIYNDPEIDIVYISNTHNYHKENVIMALQAGKHVLCEKPMGISAADVSEMISLAQAKNLFLMEAIWTRFLPCYNRMKSIISSGVIGEVKHVQASFSFNARDMGPDDRLNNPDLAGGAIWDVGIYPISLAIDLFDGAPHEVIARGMLSDDKVDLRASMLLSFSDHRHAQLLCGIDIESQHDAIISGTLGWIRLPKFWSGQSLEVNYGDTKENLKIPIDMTSSFSYEIRACYEAISDGRIEHHLMSHEHSQLISEVIDEALRQIKTTAE